MQDEKSNMGGGGGDGADARMGMIQINDLVYKLETDLSVAINRTHKTQYFQNPLYSQTQTAIAIINSGADYIDPRRSWFSFDFQLPQTLLGDNKADPDYGNAFISAYFGKNGSVLNLIDSVVVSSRSGDELSRVNDFGQLMSILIPEMFGPEWRDSIGQTIGLGSFVGGYNDSTAPNVLFQDPLTKRSEQRRIRFSIPLYLLSPIFNYGRLIPSMLMSGLRIEIKWKSLDVAVQQFWEGFPREFPADGTGQARLEFADADETEFKTYLSAGSLAGEGALDEIDYPLATVQWAYTADANGMDNGLLVLTGYAGTQNFTVVRPGTGGLRDFEPGDSVVMSMDTSNSAVNVTRNEVRFRVSSIIGAHSLGVNAQADQPDFAATAPNGIDKTGGTVIGTWRVSQRRPLPYQRDFGAPAYHDKFRTPDTPLTTYNIAFPEIALCSVQLTDAIQRTLNEFSSVNGLEIVYADYDRTSNPIDGQIAGVYTEVRKSASRALATFARVVRNTPQAHRYDSFASSPGTYWNHYQWQLGSLYFPQQRVDNGNSDAQLRHDGVLASMYNYTQDAFDRYHPKAAPTMATLRGVGIDFNKLDLHPLEVHAEHSPSPYLAPYSRYGKWGSFANGGTTVATTLERSSLFDLSGIPINNSRTLALRGELDNTQYFNTQDALYDPLFRGLLYVFLKYVRLARVFLVNCEVEQ